MMLGKLDADAYKQLPRMFKSEYLEKRKQMVRCLCLLFLDAPVEYENATQIFQVFQLFNRSNQLFLMVLTFFLRPFIPAHVTGSTENLRYVNIITISFTFLL